MSWQALEIKMFSQINAKKNSYRAVKIKCPDKIIFAFRDNSTMNDIFQRDAKRVTI